VSARDVGLLSIAAVLLSTAYYASIAAMRQGEMSVVAPFRYVGLFWALLIGWFVWGDLPNAWGLIGISLLIATGVYMIRHQRAAGRS
jgi:drug/metabolite transporter (DMT)-like permease